MHPDLDIITNNIETMAIFIGPVESLPPENGLLNDENVSKNFIQITNDKIIECRGFKSKGENEWKINSKPNIEEESLIINNNNKLATTPITKEETNEVSEKEVLTTSTFNWLFDLPFMGIKKLIINPFISAKNYLLSFFWTTAPTSNLQEGTIASPLDNEIEQKDNKISESLINLGTSIQENDMGQSSNSDNNVNNNNKRKNEVYLDKTVLDGLIENLNSKKMEKTADNSYDEEINDLIEQFPELKNAITEIQKFETKALDDKNNIFKNVYIVDDTFVMHDIKGKRQIVGQKIIGHLGGRVDRREVLYICNRRFMSDNQLNAILNCVGRQLTVDKQVTEKERYAEAVLTLKNYFHYRAYFAINNMGEEAAKMAVPSLVEITEVILKNKMADIFFPYIDKNRHMISEAVYAEALDFNLKKKGNN